MKLKRAHEEAATEHEIDQDEDQKQKHRATHQREENARCLHQDTQRKQHNAQQPNGMHPSSIEQWQSIYNSVVEVDGNYINAEPMKNRSAGSMVKAYHTLWKRITESGCIKPMTHILDNEASTKLKEAIKKNCTIQLVPPDIHKRNLAERAI
jgi:hypothetical protein